MIKDNRYSITKEYTGHASGKKQYVLRFCGKYIISTDTLKQVLMYKCIYIANRATILTGESI